MRIVVPFTQVHPLVDAALTKLAPDAERIDVSARVDSYHELMERLWREGETFLVIEHDNEPTARAIRQARFCSCWWSVSPYRGPGVTFASATNLIVGLGFTRFRKQLMAAEPDLMSEVGEINDGRSVGRQDWRRLDARMYGALRRRGYRQHVHEPPVKHHHAYGYGCACGEEHG